jgi:6-pyruvoyl-tetrahydropterin synthase
MPFVSGKFAYDLVYKYRLEIELIQERLKQRGFALDEGDFEKRVRQRLERYNQQKENIAEVVVDD